MKSVALITSHYPLESLQPLKIEPCLLSIRPIPDAPRVKSRRGSFIQRPEARRSIHYLPTRARTPMFNALKKCAEQADNVFRDRRSRYRDSAPQNPPSLCNSNETRSVSSSTRALPAGDATSSRITRLSNSRDSERSATRDTGCRGWDRSMW